MLRVTAEVGSGHAADPGGAQMLYNGVSSEDKTLKVYEGLYHKVFNEPERARVLGDLGVWLTAHV